MVVSKRCVVDKLFGDVIGWSYVRGVLVVC